MAMTPPPAPSPAPASTTASLPATPIAPIPVTPPARRTPPGRRPPMDLRLRVALWSAMAAAVVWTFLYQVSQKDADVPEFVYVNF